MDLIVAKFDGNALKDGARIRDASKSAVYLSPPRPWKNLLKDYH